jgi:hypothetical protein
MTKIVCEQCNKIGYLQRIGNNYYRIRHYLSLDPTTKKPIFQYHQVTKAYAEDQITKLSSKPDIDQLIKTNIEQLKGNIDQNNGILALESELKLITLPNVVRALSPTVRARLVNTILTLEPVEPSTSTHKQTLLTLLGTASLIKPWIAL